MSVVQLYYLLPYLLVTYNLCRQALESLQIGALRQLGDSAYICILYLSY